LEQRRLLFLDSASNVNYSIAYFVVTHKLGAMFERLLIISAAAMSCAVLFAVIKRLPFVAILFGIQPIKN